MTTFVSPVLSYTLLSPILIVLGGALIGVLVEAFASKERRPVIQLTLSLGTLILALMQLWRIRGEQSLTAAMGSLVIDGPAVLIQGSILIIAIIYSTGIAFSWLLASVAAILLILAFTALKVRSIFVYVLCGLLLWYGLYRTGVHPTLAGVILGLLTPTFEKADSDLQDIDDGSVSYIEYLQTKLHPY